VFSQPAAFTLGNLGPRLPTCAMTACAIGTWRSQGVLPVESIKLQFRAEAFNAFNTVRFSGPNTDVNGGASFGRVTSQSNHPRQIQFGLKLVW